MIVRRLSGLRMASFTRPNTPATFNPILFGIFIAIAIAFFIFFIFIVQYIYKDAIKRELNAELWIIILLIAPIIGIIVYFIVRNSKSRS